MLYRTGILWNTYLICKLWESFCWLLGKLTSYVCVFVQPQKDEGNKETELSDNEPKEEEKLGRLHFTLDYNFTDNTVRCRYSLLHVFAHYLPRMLHFNLFLYICQILFFISSDIKF